MNYYLDCRNKFSQQSEKQPLLRNLLIVRMSVMSNFPAQLLLRILKQSYFGCALLTRKSYICQIMWVPGGQVAGINRCITLKMRMPLTFQYDGNPPHTTVRDYLNTYFTQWWIAKHRSTVRPATPLSCHRYFPVGLFKGKLYTSRYVCFVGRNEWQDCGHSERYSSQDSKKCFKESELYLYVLTMDTLRICYN